MGTGQKPKLPGRSATYGVGKEIGGSVYVHRDYERVLGETVVRAKERLPREFSYTVVKYNRLTGAVSFIHSPDFDSSPEPVAGDTWTIPADGNATLRRQLEDPYIYHHKWLMVGDDYPGFDVEQSRARSRTWMTLDVNRARIGRRSYWVENVLPWL